MVVDDAHEGDHIGAAGQGIGVKITAMQLAAGSHAGSAEPRPGEFRHRRQVEQHEVQAGMALAGRLQEGTGTTAHIHQTAMDGKIIGIKDFSGDQRLARRHQRRIGRGVLRPQARPAPAIGIAPELAQAPAAALAAQHRQRVGHIGIEHAMVAHHFGDGDIAHHRPAQRPQPIATLAMLGEAERRRRLQQLLGRALRQVQPRRQPPQRLRPLGQNGEEVELHAGQQDL